MASLVNRLRYRRIKILVSLGLLSIFAISVLFIGFGTARVHPFKPKYHLTAVLDHAASIVEGMPVTLVGIEVGQVSKIALGSDNKVWVTMDVLEDVQQHIRKDSVVELNQPPIGSSSLDISMGNLSLPTLRDGDEIAITKKVILDDILEELHPRIAQFDAILENVRIFTADLNVKDGQLQQILLNTNNNLLKISTFLDTLNQKDGDVAQTLANMRKVTEQMRRQLKEVDTILVNTRRSMEPVPDAARQLPAISQNLTELSDNLVELSQAFKEMTPDIKKLIHSGNTTVNETSDVLDAVKTIPLINPAFQKVDDKPSFSAPRDQVD